VPKIRLAFLVAAAVAAAGLAGCSRASAGPGLVVYSGRNENLVRPVLERFAHETGVDIRVRYGDTTGTLATILEEGEAGRADVFLSQDAGALAALAEKRWLAKLDPSILQRVDPRFRDPGGSWVGITGRARVIAYNTDKVRPEELPPSVLGATGPRWKGKVGFPPSNASFVAFVSALRMQLGDDGARRFLEGLKANDAKRYDNNVLVLDAVSKGEVELGLVNHYYLYNEFKERADAPVANFFPGQQPGGEGTFINVSGVGILARSGKAAQARRFVEFLLGDGAQRYFRDETAEYPVAAGVEAIPELPPLASLRTIDVPLTRLGHDLEGSLELIKAVGLS
jgi:iron(III) transport system substrate-binding protein